MMEHRVTTLEVRVQTLEKKYDDHEDEDRRLHKYMTNMMEDLQARLAGIERTGVRFEADIQHRSGRDGELKENMDEIFKRLRTLERMAYVAIGSTAAFGAVISYFGTTILKLLK